MKERLKQIRKDQRLNQTEFAERIKMKQTSYSQLETGSSPILDRHVDLICHAFNVNRTWFLTGNGEMYEQQSNSEIDALINRFSFPEICAKLLYVYDGLGEERQKAVLDYARAFIASMIRDDAALVAEAIVGPSKEDGPARQQVADALNQELSPTSQPGENEIA